jgi:hypothetical protein
VRLETKKVHFMVKKELAKTYREFSEKPLEYLLKALVSRVSTAVAGLLSALCSPLSASFLFLNRRRRLGWLGSSHLRLVEWI